MNKTVKDIIGYEIGDEVWFVASIAEPMKLDIEYPSHTVNGTNTTYRFISLPTRGRIVSLYVTKRKIEYKSKYNKNGKRISVSPTYYNTGGTRFSKDDINDLLDFYNPHTDILTFEIKTEFSPGTIDSQYVWPYGKGFYTGLYKSDILVTADKTYFAKGVIQVDYSLIGKTPEEAEQKYIGQLENIVMNANKKDMLFYHTYINAINSHLSLI